MKYKDTVRLAGGTTGRVVSSSHSKEFEFKKRQGLAPDPCDVIAAMDELPVLIIQESGVKIVDTLGSGPTISKGYGKHGMTWRKGVGFKLHYEADKGYCTELRMNATPAEALVQKFRLEIRAALEADAAIKQFVSENPEVLQ